MTTNWQTKKIGEICDFFTDGNWIESKDQSSDGIRLIQTGNIGQGFFKDRVEKARYISEKTFKRLKCTEIFKGDILISRLPDPVGRACILPETGEKMITAVDCSILRLNKNTSPKFLNYYTQSNNYLSEVEQKTTGTTRKRISRKNLGLVKIPLPPLPEQHRIVKILDEVFADTAKAKENAEKNLQGAKELFESYLWSVFANPEKDWEEKEFEDSIEKVIYTKKIQRKKFLKSGKYPIVSQEKDLINGYWNDKNDLFKIKTPVSVFGDHTQILKYIDFDFVLGADGVKILQSKKFLEPKFFYYFLKNVSLKNLGYARHYRLLKEKRISFPKSLSEQKSIVAKLDALSAETKKLEEIYKQKLADLEELKKSVLKKAFDGEL